MALSVADYHLTSFVLIDDPNAVYKATQKGDRTVLSVSGNFADEEDLYSDVECTLVYVIENGAIVAGGARKVKGNNRYILPSELRKGASDITK